MFDLFRSDAAEVGTQETTNKQVRSIKVLKCVYTVYPAKGSFKRYVTLPRGEGVSKV